METWKKSEEISVWKMVLSKVENCSVLRQIWETRMLDSPDKRAEGPSSLFPVLRSLMIQGALVHMELAASTFGKASSMLRSTEVLEQHMLPSKESLEYFRHC